MTADIIQAQYDDLETIATRFGGQVEAHVELHSRVTNCVQALQQGGWEGEGAIAFFNEMEGELFPAMQRLAGALERAQSVTLEVKEIIRQAEEEAASAFDNNKHYIPADTSMTNAQGTMARVDEKTQFTRAILRTLF